MIQIDRHIEILLLNNDCVIVPGLGGFMAHHINARYNEETQSLIPPMRQVGFNSQLQINDSLLAQSYIEAYDISYPEAIRRIEDEVNELVQLIRNEGKCELNDIGVLYVNSNGKIEFRPCEAGILTPELYGLNVVDIKQLSTSVKETDAIADQTNNQTLTEPLFDSSDYNEVIKKEEGENSITIRISTIKYAATVAAIILALFVFSVPFGTSIKPEYYESYMDTGILYRILPKDIKSPSGTFGQNKSLLATPVHKKTEGKDTTSNITCIKSMDVIQQDTSKAESQHFYSIVLASRVTKVNAELFVSQLKTNGFNKAEVIDRPNGAKVIYGRFSTADEARKFLNNMRNTAQSFNDGWVMEF